MNKISWFRQCKVSQKEVVSVKKDWLKLLLTPLLLILFLTVPASIALAQLSVSADSDVQPGETYLVTVSYDNQTGDTLEGVVISTNYPSGLSFSHTPAGDEPDEDTDNTWTIGDVVDLDSDSFQVYVTVADDVVPGSQFENLFTLAYSLDGEAQSPLLEGDLTTVRDLPLQVWNFNPLGADPDSQAIYRIFYSNDSDELAENVVFTYTYPTGFAYNTFGALPAVTANTDNSWTFATVGSGTHGYVYVTLDVDPAIAEPGTYTSSLKVDYDCTIDKNTEQNTSTDATHVTVQHTPVDGVTGVWLASDPGGANYYGLGSNFDPDTGVITLAGIGDLPSANEDVLVNYSYTKSYTKTLRASTRVADGYQVLLTDLADSDDIGQQAWSPDSEWIVFKSSFSGNYDIYKKRKDGTDLTQLTTYPDCDSHPAWSPLGDKIVYKRRNVGQADIYVMDADGSNPTQLTFEDYCELWPVWSPDGTKIAYRDDDDHGMWVMDADGINRTAVFSLSGYSEAGQMKFWSPDSEWLTFTRRDSNAEIFKVRADGTELTSLTPEPDNCYQVCGFSADGETILYWYYDDYNLYTMDKDGGSVRCILENDDMFNQIHGNKVKWSTPSEPNNKNRWAVCPIALNNYSHKQIWLVSWDGTYLKQLTSEGWPYSAVMSPDGSAIATCDGSDIYVINLGSTDTDNDRLKDWEEFITGTDPEKADTDGGGESDANEVDNGRDPLDPADDDFTPGPEDDDDGLCFISTVR